MHNTKANISLFELLKFYLVQNSLFKVVEDGGHQISKHNTRKILGIATLSGSRSRSKTPPILLTFEIFNMNVHNCFAYSCASKNVMSLVLAQKIISKPKRCNSRIIQIERSGVTMVGDILNVFIRLSSKLLVTQTIYIYVVDIPDVYGMLLSKDWSFLLHGYFATNYSHLWLTHKGKENRIRVDREQHNKHIVVELGSSNEVVTFKNSSHLGYYVNTLSFKMILHILWRMYNVLKLLIVLKLTILFSTF